MLRCRDSMGAFLPGLKRIETFDHVAERICCRVTLDHHVVTGQTVDENLDRVPHGVTSCRQLSPLGDSLVFAGV